MPIENKPTMLPHAFEVLNSIINSPLWEKFIWMEDVVPGLIKIKFHSGKTGQGNFSWLGGYIAYCLGSKDC